MQPTGLSLNGGTLQHLSGGATLEQTQTTLNDIINRLNSLLEVQSFSDTANKRFIQGYVPGRWPGGDFGLAISQPAQDVTSVAFNQLLFAWDYTTNKQYFYGGTQIFYDPSSGLDIGQQGILPDGTGGSAWAKPGNSVNNAFGH